MTPASLARDLSVGYGAEVWTEEQAGRLLAAFDAVIDAGLAAFGADAPTCDIEAPYRASDR